MVHLPLCGMCKLLLHTDLHIVVGLVHCALALGFSCECYIESSPTIVNALKSTVACTQCSIAIRCLIPLELEVSVTLNALYLYM